MAVVRRLAEHFEHNSTENRASHLGAAAACEMAECFDHDLSANRTSHPGTAAACKTVDCSAHNLAVNTAVPSFDLDISALLDDLYTAVRMNHQYLVVTVDYSPAMRHGPLSCEKARRMVDG